MNYTDINSSTENFLFDRDNYFFVKNIWNPNELMNAKVPEERGTVSYHDSVDKCRDSDDVQVSGSKERYNYPKYREIHYQVGKKIEKILGKELYPTYYFDRYYFVGQELSPHVDRPACEISISIHISSNLNAPWHFEIETPYGENHKVNCSPGDGIIYRGCDAKHWRSPLPSKYSKLQRFALKAMMKEDDTYYHQIFFHYVLANGHRSHHAFDNCR